MNIQQILQVSRCQAQVDCGSKKRALEIAASLIADDYPALTADYVFRQLLGRERLGSTGLGQGIAIPHCRVENCTHAIGSLITLMNKVDFESVDGEPVDVLFTLVVPEQASDDHVHMLADIVKVFNNPSQVKQLRASKSADDLYQCALTLFGAGWISDPTKIYSDVTRLPR